MGQKWAKMAVNRDKHTIAIRSDNMDFYLTATHNHPQLPTEQETEIISNSARGHLIGHIAASRIQSANAYCNKITPPEVISRIRVRLNGMVYEGTVSSEIC